MEIPTAIFVDEVHRHEHLRRVRRKQPLTEPERARLARAHRESGAVRDLMEIEDLTLEDFA